MSNPESLLLSPNSSSCITNSYTEQRHSKRHSSDSLEIGKTFAGHRRHASDGSEASAPSPNLIAEAKNIEAASPFLLPFESLVFDANFDDTFQTSLGLMQLDKHNGGSLGHQVQTGQDEAQVRHSNQSTSQQSLHPFPTDDLSKSTNFLETDERTGLHSYNEMLLQQQTHASQLQQLQQQQQQQHQHQHQQQQQQRQFQQQPFGQETTYTPTGQFDAATSFAQDAMNIKSNGLNPRAFGVPMRNQIFEPTFAKADQLDVQQASNRRSLTPNLQFSVNNEFMPSSSAYLLPEDALVNPNLDLSNNNYLSSPSSFSNTNSNPNLSPGPFGSSARGSFDATASSHDFDLQMGNFTSTFDASDTYIDPLDGPSLSHRNSFDQSIGTASYDSSPLYPTNLSQIPSSSDYPLQAYFTQEQLHARRQHHLQQQHILEQSHLEEYQAITQHNAGINIFQSMYADAPNIALNPPTPSQRPSPNSRAFLRPEYPFPSAQPQMIVPTITTTVPTVTVSHPASDHAMSHNGHIPSFNLSPESAMPQIDGLSPPRGNRGRSNSDSRLMVAGGRARARSGNAIAHRGRGTTHRSTSATSASGSQSRSSSGSGSGSTSGDYLSARESSSNSRVQKFSSDGHSRRKSFSSMRDRSLDPHSDGSGPSNKQKNPATFICPIEDCGKRFTRAYNLRSHQRTHTNERPFICEVCGKAFARQHDRKRHEALHSGVKNHECPACHKKFARMDALSRHFKSETGKDCLKGREAEFDFLSHMDDGDDIGDEDEEWN